MPGKQSLQSQHIQMAFLSGFKSASHVKLEQLHARTVQLERQIKSV